MVVSSLHRHYYRWVGLSIVIAGILIFGVLQALDLSYVENWGEKIFIMNHYIIILGLVMMSSSLEKNEDERIRTIRFIVLRFSNLLTILGLILYAAISILLDRVEFNLRVMFYIVESGLILYQLLFRLYLRLNPKWIFREGPGKKAPGIVMASCLIFLTGWLIYVVIQYKA